MSIANKIVILIIVCSLFNHAFSFIPLKTPELYGVSKELLYTGKGVSKGYTNYIYNHDSVFITSEVVVPAGTRLQRSRAAAAFGKRGGAEQFELIDKIPKENFGKGQLLE